MAVRMSAPPLPEEAPFLPCDPLPSAVSRDDLTAAPTFPEGWSFLPCEACSSGTSTCRMFLLALMLCKTQTPACHKLLDLPQAYPRGIA